MCIPGVQGHLRGSRSSSRFKESPESQRHVQEPGVMSFQSIQLPATAMAVIITSSQGTSSPRALFNQKTISLLSSYLADMRICKRVFIVCSGFCYFNFHSALLRSALLVFCSCCPLSLLCSYSSSILSSPYILPSPFVLSSPSAFPNPHGASPNISQSKSSRKGTQAQSKTFHS